MSWITYDSPLGTLTLVASPAGALEKIRFPGGGSHLAEADRAALERPARQLDEYFAGERDSFDLPVELSGSTLQLAVWSRLRQIPYGETVSYGELTEDLDAAVFPVGLEPYQRVRAVGTEIGRTPVPIVVPCHRVVGSDGSLTGYGGGLHRKRALLDLEQGVAQLLPLT